MCIRGNVEDYLPLRLARARREPKRVKMKFRDVKFILWAVNGLKRRFYFEYILKFRMTLRCNKCCTHTPFSASMCECVQEKLEKGANVHSY